MSKNIKSKMPWPTKAVMTQIYDLGLWGRGELKDKFYSGDGSRDPQIIDPYINFVSNFLKSFRQKICVLDLGCGDFNIGKNFVQFCKKYYAIDIVDELISYNQSEFKYPNLNFLNLDIVHNELPMADCVIIRQVLQHLSNNEIGILLPKLSFYKFIILTEHLPEEEFEANKDITTGQGIRLKHKSGVDLEQSPFNLKPKKVEVILRSQSAKYKGIIETKLYQMF